MAHDIFSGFPNPLADSGENKAIEDETPLPAEMAKEDTMQATVGWVKRLFRTHRETCPAIRRLRRWAYLLVFMQGVVAALGVVGYFAGKTALEKAVNDAAKTTLREAVRGAVREELRDLGVLHGSLPARPQTMAVDP